jgi:rRNA-processing protein FCF1
MIRGAMPLLSAFLDTNTFIHFPRVDQIDWLPLLDGMDVRLIVAPVVIRELNRHKDFPTSTKTRTRASAALKALEAWADEPQPVLIRASVELQFRNQDPLIDFARFNLSREIQDDQLIASILEYGVEAHDATTILVTADLGLKLKARAHNIPVVQLPADLRLPDELLEDERKRRELEAEIRRLRDRLPRVSLLFNNRKPHLEVQLGGSDRPSTGMSSAAEIRAKYPKMEVTVNDVASRGFSGLLLGGANEISAKDITDYNTQLDSFYERYQKYTEQLGRFQVLSATTVRLDILAVNDGNCPADDLDIFMHFPDGFALLDESKLTKAPVRPEPPLKPKTLAEKMASVLDASRMSVPSSIYRDFSGAIPTPRNVGKPFIRRTNSYDVSVPIALLKHGFAATLDPLYVVFGSSESVRSFAISYRIHASNLPDASEGQLHVVFDHPAVR